MHNRSHRESWTRFAANAGARADLGTAGWQAGLRGVAVAACLAVGTGAAPAKGGDCRIDPKDLGRTAVQTLAEEFDSLSLWDGRRGRWATAFPWSDGTGGTLASNGELQWYVDARHAPTRDIRPWAVGDGVLSITAEPVPPARRARVGGYGYVSGLLTTHPSFRQTYGYFEIRARLPAGKGLWPAFWLLPPNGSWPPEIDVFELLGDRPDTLYVGAHYNASGRPAQVQQAVAVPGGATGWHRYGVNWDARRITWYVDRVAVFSTDTPADMHAPMYLLLNLAVGGRWPGAPDASTRFPAVLAVDEVRAYRSRCDRDETR